MKVTSTREVHVTLSEAEVTGIVNALSSVLGMLSQDTWPTTVYDQQGLLLKLKTELAHAPR